MNVTVVFLGFLRALNQIDATFKYAYLERRDFGAPAMDATVARINEAVEHTIRMIGGNLKGEPVQQPDSGSPKRVDRQLGALADGIAGNGARGEVPVAPVPGAAGESLEIHAGR